MAANFFKRGYRTYLVKNPNPFGNGTDLGYYREQFDGAIKAVALVPYYAEKEFGEGCQQQAQEWLKRFSGVE